MNSRNKTLALVVVAALGLAACDRGEQGTANAATATQRPAVASVNGKPVSAEAFELWVQSQMQKKPDELTPEQRKQALDALVNLYVAGQEGERQGLAKDGEMAARIELERLNVLANALFQKHVEGATPSDEELKAEYDRQVAQLPKQEFRARHILVQEEQQARDLIAQLGKGAKFEDLAKQHSTDPGSKERGGDLDWFGPGMMVKPFSDAVASLNKGEYTKEPVRSDFGWHVIRLDDVRASTMEVPPFEQVKDRMGPMVQQRQLRDYIDKLRSSAKVEQKL